MSEFPINPTYLNVEYFFNKLLNFGKAVVYFFAGGVGGDFFEFKVFLFVISLALMLFIFYATIMMEKLRNEERHHMEHEYAKAMGDDYYAIRDHNRTEPIAHTFQSLERPSETPTQIRWRDIVTYSNSANPSDWKVAIIDADNMLDELLTALGYPGQSIGEKLRNAAHSFPTADKAGKAHGIRNRIAHDPTYKPTHNDIVEAISLYETVFKEFNYI